ncbi:hypothetical protein VTN96DRAFT_3525 [Rasamsonia emersonii]
MGETINTQIKSMRPGQAGVAVSVVRAWILRRALTGCLSGLEDARRERGGRSSQRERAAAVILDDRSSLYDLRFSSAIWGSSCSCPIVGWLGCAFRDRIIRTYLENLAERKAQKAMIDGRRCTIEYSPHSAVICQRSPGGLPSLLVIITASGDAPVLLQRPAASSQRPPSKRVISESDHVAQLLP